MRADVPVDKGHSSMGATTSQNPGRCLRGDSLSFRRDDRPVNRQHRAHAYVRNQDISRGGPGGNCCLAFLSYPYGRANLRGR
jgi:hypothetical protein